MNRTEAREKLMQMLFQMETQSDFSDEALDRYMETYIEEDDAKEKKYIKDVYTAFKNNKEEIDSLIEKYSKGWKLSRIAKVDLSAMRICIAEYRFLEEGSKTPVNAAVSEAVRIAKKYGTENSGKFVNGILGEINRKEV